LIETVAVWDTNKLVCPKTGNEVFTQHLWWRVETHETDERKEDTDFYVSAWRMAKQVMTIPNREGQWWVARFYDPKDKVFRMIRAKQYMETITTIDFEVEDRKRLDDSKRSGLRKE